MRNLYLAAFEITFVLKIYALNYPPINFSLSIFSLIYLH